MLKFIENSNIAFIGGGKFCKMFLQFLQAVDFQFRKPVILGVADSNANAEGLRYARETGIFTTHNYEDLYQLEGLQVLIELTSSNLLTDQIKATKPAHLRLIDHIETRSLWNSLQIERERQKALEEIAQAGLDIEKVEPYFNRFTNQISTILTERNQRYEEIERSLVASERAMAQIIGGSTIPTFVIDQNHIVTHWNRPCEKLTGYSAKEIVGTSNQWKPFRKKMRPIMADLILDGVDEDDVWSFYGTRWKKSELIAGAYEAEEFFDHLGENGKWLFFTAAPIKAPDGTVIGAIETLWDRTEEKQAEAELKANEQTLSQIINGSTIPTFVIGRDHKISHWNKALEILTGYPAQQMIGTQRQWEPFYTKKRASIADTILGQVSEEEIQRLYGDHWRKSGLVNGAYEAEKFFPNLGKNGKWCWFTAAPIKTPDGRVIGAIETIWDKTEEKKAQQDQEQHTRELATLCSIYATLSTHLDLEGRINAAIQEVVNIFLADCICIFILEPDGKMHLKYNYGYSKTLCNHNQIAEPDSIIADAARSGNILVVEQLEDIDKNEAKLLRQEGVQSAVYIPITGKDKSSLGVIRLGSTKARHFALEEKHILELIGNRIGVAIENALL